MAIEETHTRQGQAGGAPEDGGVTFTRLAVKDEACVLEIHGDLDIAVSGMLGHELDELLDLDIPQVAVDLSGVQFMDSSALSALVQAHERARERTQQFVLLRPSPACAKVLNITGLDRVFGVS
jgi:anti-sigma B factor antagonist